MNRSEVVKLTPWVCVPDQGGYFRLFNGELQFTPMKEDLSPEIDRGELNAVDVDFFALDKDDTVGCLWVIRQLEEMFGPGLAVDPAGTVVSA